jgi:hypothetical protein
MPKRRSFPDVLDEVRQIDIAWLRSRNYLTQGCRVKGHRLSWKNGSSVSINLDVAARFVEITDTSTGSERTSRIRLESRRSNLGRGTTWYFVCPVTSRLCRKLYGIGGYFYSRHAFPGAMYRSQVEPKGDRRLRRYISLNGTTKHPRAEWDPFDRNRFRKYYAGKPTKLYLKYLERVEKTRDLLKGGPLDERAAAMRSRQKKVLEILRSSGHTS